MSLLPRSSPWGAVQKWEEIIDGVFLVNTVNTASHGGIMVRYAASEFLSSEALNCGFRANRSFCFGQDKCEQVVIRELLDKNLWRIPDRIIDKAKYEEKINESLQKWQPEYWKARQCFFAAQIVTTDRKDLDFMIDARKDIVFRDEGYNIKFKIKDGDSIKITLAYNGEEVTKKCRYIDDAHLNVGSSPYHNDEFAGIMTKTGNKYEPIPDQEPKLNVVIAEPGNPPYDAEIPMSLEALRNILGGEIDIISQDEFSARIQGTDGNGKIMVCGINGDNLTSLHPYDARTQKRELAESVPAEEEKKPTTLAKRLETGKAKAAEYNGAKQPSDLPQKKKDPKEH